MLIKGEFLRNVFIVHNIYIVNHQLEIVGDFSSINHEKIYTVVGYDLTQTNTQIQGVKLCNIMVEEAFIVESLGEVYKESITIDKDTNINDNNAEENTLNGTNKCENDTQSQPNNVIEENKDDKK